MENETRSDGTQRPEGRKKPYMKPTVTSEKIFETTALACGKVGGQSAKCNAAPKAS